MEKSKNNIIIDFTELPEIFYSDLNRLEKNVAILMRTIFKNQGLSLPASNEFLLSEEDVDNLHISSSGC